MKNYIIVSQDGLSNLVELNGSKVIKLKPESRSNMVRKNGAARTEQVRAEIKEASAGPKVTINTFVINAELTEDRDPKKIKLNGKTFGNVASKGKVEVKVMEATNEQVVPSMPEVEVKKEEPVAEEKTEEVKTPDFSFPQFDFNSLKFEPTPEPEDEKETSVSLSDAVNIPSFDEPVAESTEEEKKEEPVPEAKEEIPQEEPAQEEVQEEPTVEEKSEETVTFNADTLRDALKAKLNAVEKEAQEKSEKELEEARKAKEEAEAKLAEFKKKLAEKERKLDETSAALEELQKEVSEITRTSDRNAKELEAYKEVFSEIVDTKEPVMRRAA